MQATVALTEPHMCQVVMDRFNTLCLAFHYIYQAHRQFVGKLSSLVNSICQI